MNQLFYSTNSTKDDGFTLLEILLYIGLLAAISTVGIGIFISLSISYQRNHAQDEVTQNLRIARQIIEQNISQATQINSVGGSTLNLTMASSTISPTIFSLSNGAITLQQAGGAASAITSNKITVSSLSFTVENVTQAQIDPINHWAWSGGATTTTSTAEGAGWIDFNPAVGNVRVPIGTSGDLSGYAYSPGIGYISLNCITTDSCSTSNYKVTESATGTLSGWAWNDGIGWISFNSGDTTSTIPYSVNISSSTGDFTGWAWSENIGWISFNATNTLSINLPTPSPYKVSANPLIGRPLYAIKVSITASYNNTTNNPRLSYSDTENFSVPLAQPSVITVSSISPSSATSTASGITVTGSGFQSGAIVKLSRPGNLDVYASTTFNYVSQSSLQSGAFDITGVSRGSWNVVVINPDGQVGTLPSGFSAN